MRNSLPFSIRRYRAKHAVWAALITLAITVAADHLGWLGRSGDDWKQFDQKSAVVTHVVDGDTIDIRVGFSETRVRLVGVDAPEMNVVSRKPPEHWAQRATDYVKARADGKAVTIKLEPLGTRDRYDRLLAYVYLSDNESLNFALVRDGEAYADRRFKHSLIQSFETAENDARTHQRGLWKDLKDDEQPAWRQKWLHERAERKKGYE
jgi:endonuclease YncB( thermonuclease family)